MKRKNLIERGKITLTFNDKNERVLCLLTKRDPVFITECDGNKNTISLLKETFKYLDFSSRFNYEPEKTTQITEVQVYEMIGDARFEEIFNSFDVKLNKLCLTLQQIRKFCIINDELLRNNDRETFFLLKNKRKFFVAIVTLWRDGSLSLYVDNLSNDYLWNSC